eukprot:gene9360-19413_t
MILIKSQAHGQYLISDKAQNVIKYLKLCTLLAQKTVFHVVNILDVPEMATDTCFSSCGLLNLSKIGQLFIQLLVLHSSICQNMRRNISIGKKSSRTTSENPCLIQSFGGRNFRKDEAYNSHNWVWDEDLLRNESFTKWINITQHNQDYLSTFNNLAENRQHSKIFQIPVEAILTHLKSSSLQDVYTNRYGFILHNDSCQYIRNGGCTYMTHRRIYSFSGRQRTLSKVAISLGSGASGSYHFPMESVTALAAIHPHILQQSYILVENKNPYIMGWLSLLNISSAIVLGYDHIYISKLPLLVPEMGRCGLPYATQLNWLYDRMIGAIYGYGRRPIMKDASTAAYSLMSSFDRNVRPRLGVPATYDRLQLYHVFSISLESKRGLVSDAGAQGVSILGVVGNVEH